MANRRLLWLCLSVLGLMLQCKALPADQRGKEMQLLSQETANPVGGTSNESDVEVEELHSWGQKGGSRPLQASPGTSADKEEKRSSLSDKVDLISEFTSSRDTPRDMAEYIFWTGDEKSVTSAIKDFVDQGLMNQSEGIAFLEEVRYHLMQMQQRYGDVNALEPQAEESNKALKMKDQSKEDNQDVEDLKKMVSSVVAAMTSAPVTSTPVTSPTPAARTKPQGEIVVTAFGASKNQMLPSEVVAEEAVEDRSSEERKSATVGGIVKGSDPLESAPLADLLNNEFTLEEIIYQLARILFTQSLNQAAGNPEAEEALQKFADFLEKESNEGKLSPQLQKKVLDVLLMSLFDAMGDQKNGAAGLAKMAVDLQKKRTLTQEKL